MVLQVPLRHLTLLLGEDISSLPQPALIARIKALFGFLGEIGEVELRDDTALLHLHETAPQKTAECAKLADRAAKKAREGDYSRAVELLRRALPLSPTQSTLHRDLAMALMELGQHAAAKDALIDALKLDATDAWSFVVLGNLYAKHETNFPQARRFFERALELSPGDAWALNSLAAACHDSGQSSEALALFERAIQANPDFPNPYYGAAGILAAQHQTDAALAVLHRLFSCAKLQDARSQATFDRARQLYATLQADLAQRDQSAAFKCVQHYKAEMEALSGYPIRSEETEFADQSGARIQLAWKHRRPHHLILTRRGYAPELLCHLEAHELTHLKLEAEARQAGKNLFFVTTPHTQATALRTIAGDFRKWEQDGYPAATINQAASSMIAGLCGFLFNCPLDMLIERHLHATFPVLRPAQFLSVQKLANEHWQTNSDPEIRRRTPRKIMSASLALNGAYALFLDTLFAGASAFAAPYRSLDTFALSQRLYQFWHEHTQDAEGGGGCEYRLVDGFAELIGLRSWYEWQPDPGHHDLTAESSPEGTTNPELLQQKHPAAVPYLLSALQRYEKLPLEKIREIALEIALLGQSGLDYADADKKYKLRALPAENFSGLEAMCLMYAAFKRVAPESAVGMNLDEPFLTALEIFNHRRAAS